MDIFKKHSLLFGILGFVILTLPQAIDSYINLYDKIKNTDMQISIYQWVLPVLPFVGLFLFAMVIWQTRKSEVINGETRMVNSSIVHKKPSRLEHDGVLWEDQGRNAWGNISVVGPLCPKDFAFLGIEHNDKIESHPKWDSIISRSEYHSRLICPECKSKYTLGKQMKTLQESHDEVYNRFEGKRRREKET